LQIIGLILLLSVLILSLNLSHDFSEPRIRLVSGLNSQALSIGASATPSAGRAPLNVTFQGSISGGVPPYAIFWDFGDGATSTGLTLASHIYSMPASYAAEFWVQDSDSPASKQVVRLTVTVHATGRLQVSVLKQDFQPLNGATVRMIEGPEGQPLLEGGTGGRGLVDFGLVASGAYGLEVSAVGFRTNTSRVTVFPGDPTPAIIVLVPQESSNLTFLFPYLAAVGLVSALAVFYVVRRKKRQPSQGTKGSRGTVRRGQPLPSRRREAR
jgi:hypothetical protein